VILIVTGGEVFTPAAAGAATVLALNGAIARVGSVDTKALETLDVPLQVLAAHACVVVPGFIDPHVHLIGGSGEEGYHTASPEIFLEELITAGVTTVVGCLGVDTTMKAMDALVGKAKALCHEGLSAYLYSGGYDVPPVTAAGSLRRDIILIDQVIGVGEIAIADRRSAQPTVPELARVVADAYVGGLLSGKAGVTHFHVGDGREGLLALRRLLDEHEIDPACLYPSHVERTPELIREAAQITGRGVTVDVDTVANDLAQALDAFLDHGGSLAHLTVSSDASVTPPVQRLNQLRACVLDCGRELAQLLPLVTTNAARVLKLQRKGRIEPGMDADLLVLRRETLELVHVVAKGQILMRDGVVTQQDRFLQKSGRRIRLDGQQA
jgi:beta-aspartyl-dipeptidase (metallo-type)